jgi:3-hydroxyisobutyrate dehydrogenase-like beta-hydroxyacid dehydrogenase
MAETIARSGHDLIVWARRPSVVDPFVALGATVADSPASLAAQSEIVGTCVMADDDIVELAEAKGMLAAMAPGSVFVNHATIHPETARRLGETAKSHGIHLVDAPVSGSPATSHSKGLLVMAGGEVAAIDAAMPMLGCYGRVIRCGSLGAGQIAKLINNGIFFANMELAHRGLAMAAALGIEPALMRQVLAAGSGGSYAANIEDIVFNPAGAQHISELARKDVELLRKLSTEQGLSPGVVHEVASHLVDSMSALAASVR